MVFGVSPHFAAKKEKGTTLRIVDYQRHLNPRFKKHLRKETRFIIVHSTESSLPSALRTLSRGRVRHGRYVTHGGHAHFLIAREGTVYRILDPKYWANHAGVSMWDGFANLSDISVGVELEGFHNVPFEEMQYQSLQKLLNQLKQRYAVEDRDVLEHCRVAYSKPNRFHSINARGRKSDPGMGNFDRLRAGLLDEYAQDPDVRAGRMIGSLAIMRAGGQVATQVEEAEDEEDEEAPEAAKDNFPVRLLRTGETAWKIAGVQFNSATTVYSFPNGAVFRGNEIKDWSDVPAGTEVRLGVPLEKPNLTAVTAVTEREKKVVSPHQAEVIVPEVTAVLTPWKIANALHNSGVTFYVYPDGSLRSGDSLRDTALVPASSKVLVAYRPIPRPQARDKLGEDLQEIYMDPRTLYLFPDRTLKSGDQIQDFSTLPPQVLVFAKIE
jgi:N-acetylmuramoyl-L-alanine amidase